MLDNTYFVKYLTEKYKNRCALLLHKWYKSTKAQLK